MCGRAFYRLNVMLQTPLLSNEYPLRVQYTKTFQKKIEGESSIYKRLILCLSAEKYEIIMY